LWQRSRNEATGSSGRIERLEPLERLEQQAVTKGSNRSNRSSRSSRQMRTIKIQQALKTLQPINQEIRYRSCFEGKTFSVGLIAFCPTKNSDAKQINHNDRDVICQVLKGQGRLRSNGRRVSLRPGIICHIPKGTPHDFAAAKSGELILIYSLIKTK
jgi:quercetin dioxygenase-like cupin family protein